MTPCDRRCLKYTRLERKSDSFKMGDRLKKLFVDSRFRSSGTPTDFAITFADDIECDEDQTVYVNAVSFPNTLYTVQDTNNKLYVIESEYRAATDSYEYHPRLLTINDGNYSGLALEAALRTALTTNRPISNVDKPLTITYLPHEGRIRVTTTGNDRIWFPSSEELMEISWKSTNWNGGPAYSVTNPNAFNDVLRVTSPTQFQSSFTSGLLDLRVHHTLCLHSSLTSYQTLDSRGSRTAIARIPVNADFGYVVHWQSNLSEDCLNVGGQRFRTLHFRLANAYGTAVDLHGGHVSLELVFAIAK